ncbi:MAG: DUF370 domain-containing protein [Candidatus Faecousia sp.]|nr:DUF370 domain-containing protein [Candidatus Faecousia sp.]
MVLVNIGFGSMVAAGRVLSILAPDSAPIKRVIQEAKDRGMLIDASYGRKTKSVLLMDTDHVILSAVSPETITARVMGREEPRQIEEESV